MIINKKHIARVFPLVLLVGSVSIFTMDHVKAFVTYVTNSLSREQVKITTEQKYIQWAKEDPYFSKYSIPKNKAPEVMRDIDINPYNAVLFVGILDVHPNTYIECVSSSVFGRAVLSVIRHAGKNQKYPIKVIEKLVQCGGSYTRLLNKEGNCFAPYNMNNDNYRDASYILRHMKIVLDRELEMVEKINKLLVDNKK